MDKVASRIRLRPVFQCLGHNLKVVPHFRVGDNYPPYLAYGESDVCCLDIVLNQYSGRHLDHYQKHRR